MEVRALNNTANLELVTLHSTFGAIALWVGVLVREWPQLTTYGRLCDEASGILGHCPLCLPAAALTAVSVTGLTMMFGRGARRA